MAARRIGRVCPAAAPPVLVYYQSVSFDPHHQIFISAEWKSAVFNEILGEVYGVSWSDPVDLCFRTSNHFLSTIDGAVEESLPFNRQCTSSGDVPLYSAGPSPR